MFADPSTTVFVILAATTVLFATDRFRLDAIALVALIALVLSGSIDTATATAGFGSPLVVTIAALFVVGEGLSRTGVADRLGQVPTRVAGGRPRVALAVVLALAGLMSAFMSSTGAVAILIPVVVGLTRTLKISAARFLLPMAFVAQLGGMWTLIGTPPNLVADAALTDAGHDGLGFFSMTPVGLAIGAVGIALLVGPLFGRVGRRPAASERPDPAAAGDDDASDGSDVQMADLVAGWGLDSVIARARIPAGSSAVGRTLDDLDLRQGYEVSVLEILRPHRDGEPHRALPFSGRRHLHVGDVVTLKGPPGRAENAIAALCWDTVGDELPSGPAGLSPATGLVEAVLTPRSRLLNRSLREAQFRDRFGVNVLAIKRRGRVLTGRVSREKLRFGDSLLLIGPWTTIQSLRSERRDLVIAAPPSEMHEGLFRAHLAPAALGVVAVMLVAMTFGWVPMAITALLAAMAMVATGCVTASEAYRSVQWPSLVLLAAMLPLADALAVTGGTDRIVAGVLGALGHAGPHAVMIAFLIVTSLLSQVISNTATAVLLAPVAIQVASALDVAATPLVVAVAVAASTAFATPVASPVNTLVLGPGHYRFGDFVRVGVPLQIAALVVAAITIPLVFGF